MAEYIVGNEYESTVRSTAQRLMPWVRKAEVSADVTKDAKSSGGYLPVWTKDEKTWLEVPAALLDQPMFFGSSVSSGIGDMPLLPGLMGEEQVVVLRRVGNKFKSDGPLSRHHMVVVEGGHQYQPTVPRQTLADRDAIVLHPVIEHDVGTMAARILDLQTRGVGRHDDHSRSAYVARSASHGLRMVSR
jgi:hypothetical protein